MVSNNFNDDNNDDICFNMDDFLEKDIDSNKSVEITSTKVSPEDELKLAKAFAFRTLAFGIVLIICLCVYRTDNLNETLKLLMPVIVGILSFFAGHLTCTHKKE